MRPKKRTKIVATLGPASNTEDVLREMILAGLDVVRFNFSHGKEEFLAPLATLVRRLAHELDVPLAILGDLQGPRIRVGEVENGTITLKTDDKLILTPETVLGTPERVSVSYPDLAKDVYEGARLLLDDGNISLRVEKVDNNGDVVTRIHRGADLSSKRGINLPGLRVSLPSITEKDYGDVDFAISQGFDFLAMSFVQSVEDVRGLNQYLADKGSPIPVVSKIERKSALDDIEDIVDESYGVMVARGDLALEMSIQEIPIAQKKIIATCRSHATPVITATQMLESMIQMSKPTRAEATDVANAILDGTDAIMLSGETAIGKYPVEVIQTMSTIAESTEQAWQNNELRGPAELDRPRDIEANVAYASRFIAESVNAEAIVTYTASGATTRRVSCHRPAMPILALTNHKGTARRLALSWGVETALTEHITTTDHMVTVAKQQVEFEGVAGPGDTIVITAGTPPYGRSGRTNTLKVERLAGKKVEKVEQ